MQFANVVFAGGGSRCLWQAGFWISLCETVPQTPKQIACVSAGSAVACMLFSGTQELGLQRFKEMTAGNARNFYLERIGGPERVFPHYKMYRQIMLELLDESALLRLHRGPQLSVLISRPPWWLGPRGGVFVGFLAYLVEKKWKNPVHPQLARQIGFRAELISVRRCTSPQALTDLILASSCTPPMTPILMRDGRPSLDGGLVDNVPVCGVNGATGETLVMLTRRYDKLPDVARRIYVQPSRSIRIDKWDYTNPDGLQRAFDLGREDGARFAAGLHNRRAS